MSLEATDFELVPEFARGGWVESVVQLRVGASELGDGLSARGVVRHKGCHVVHDATDDEPAVILLVVSPNLVPAEYVLKDKQRK